MKGILLLTKSKSIRFCSLIALALMFANFGFGQQVIGEFPIMDGGMEGQMAGTIPTAGSSNVGTPQTTWTVSSSSNSAQRLMFDDSTMARTGRFFATSALSASATNVRVQAPSTVAPDTLLTSTEYTIQYFYRGNIDPGTDLDGGIYLNNTSGGRTADVTNVTPFAPGVWTKAYAERETNTVFNASNWAVARIRTDSAGMYLDTLSFDDFVVYAGTYDDVAPDAPTAATSTYTVNGTTADVAWVAPAGGVDGGGYVVVKYMTMPAADNDINQNGIYRVGNTTSNGTASLLGTVVYVGMTTSYSETYTPGAYYKVYTADKAFNYSDELTLEDATMIGVPEIEASNISVYPNPVNNAFSIVSDDVEIESISVFSIDGKEVIQQNVVGNKTVDVSGLESGVYLLKLKSFDQVFTKKIIIE